MAVASSRNPALRSVIKSSLTGERENSDPFLADPVIESTLPWIPSNETILSCQQNGLIDSDFFDAVTQASTYTFPPDRYPYRHRVEAWSLLSQKQPRSVLVSSGTSSGKTECFLFPLMSSLAREIREDGASEGVRAIFLYPLNALIESQKERLSS